jgi:hypothetical protein
MPDWVDAGTKPLAVPGRYASIVPNRLPPKMIISMETIIEFYGQSAGRPMRNDKQKGLIGDSTGQDA